MSTEIQKYADQAMFQAAPIDEDAKDSTGNIIPKVHLLWMTPDPLGAIAAMSRMYIGTPTYDLADITDEERVRFFEDMQNTHLKAPLEAVKLHFFIEGVTRSFTHQMVRQRTAAYAQESLRFAVKDNMKNEIAKPPSVAQLPEDDPRRVVWDKIVDDIDEGYNQLIGAGVPAEDARGLLPHAITTRLNYVTDLRALADHAGNRLCTQAQFEWRYVFLGIVDAIRNYNPYKHLRFVTQIDEDRVFSDPSWQFHRLADSGLFRPICYQLGKCPVKASFDRGCTIRERVDMHEKSGTPSSEWGDINPAEWMADPKAAWVK